MVSKASKDRMRIFVCDRIDEACRYTIQSADNNHILVSQRADRVENPLTVDIRLLNRQVSSAELRRIFRENKEKGIYTGHLFYKDGDLYHRRLGIKAYSKRDKSLVDYGPAQRNRMLEFRIQEKDVLQLRSDFPNSARGHSQLEYYQPPTDKLAESVRIYAIEPVMQRYGHLREGDAGYGFAKDGNAERWGLSTEREEERILGPMGFSRPSNGRVFAMLTTVAPPEPVQGTLFADPMRYMGHCPE